MQFEPEPEDEWQAHCRNAVAMAEGETAPEEPVMAGEVVRVEAEAESEPVVAGEVVPEIVEGEEGATTEPVVASETIERDAPAEGAAGESRGWFSSLLGPRRESGAEADAEASKPEIEQAAGEVVPEVMEREAPAEGSTRGSVEATGKGKNRPPSPAPADLRLVSTDDSDRLVSTDEISGDYRGSCFGSLCTSMTVVPLGADMIEANRSYWLFLPPLCVGPYVEGDVWIRNPDTNAFRLLRDPNPESTNVMTFSADGTARKPGEGVYKWQKRPGSQKRAFQKVETRDLAGCWCSCCCLPFLGAWPFSLCLCTTKKALNQDQYDEWGCGCSLVPPFIVLPRRDDPGRAGPYTRTRFYANGHPTNGFYAGIFSPPESQQNFIRWYSDASYGSGGLRDVLGVFSKKLC